MRQKNFKLLLMRVTPLSHYNTSSLAVLQWLNEMLRMRQADIRKKEVKGFYWAFVMDFLYWALRSGDAKYTAAPECAADKRLERKISARTNGEI